MNTTALVAARETGFGGARRLAPLVPLLLALAYPLVQPWHRPWVALVSAGVASLVASSLALSAESRRATGALCGGIALIVGSAYLRTLSTTTGPADILEWAAVVHRLSIGHGPGYPLYVMLGKVFTTLVPYRDLAWRMNLYSAAAATLAVVVTFLLATRLSRSRTAGLLAALVLAFAPAFWTQAVLTEVYALNSLLTVLVLFCLLVWTDSVAEGRLALRWLMATAFCLGMGMVHHLSTGFLAAVVVVAVLWNAPRALYRPRPLLAVAGSFAVGLLPVLYIPWRWLATYGRPVGVVELVRYLTASDYRRLFYPERLLADPTRLLLYRHELLAQFSWLLLLVALVGVAWLWRRRRQWLTWLGVLYVAFVGARLAYYVWDGWVIQTPAHIVGALLVACGLAGLAGVVSSPDGRLRWREAVFWTLATAVVLGSLWRNGPSADESAGWPGYARAKLAMAEDLPPGAWVVTDPDLGSGLLYEQMIRGKRPDVRIAYADSERGQEVLSEPESAMPLFLLNSPPPEGRGLHFTSRGPLVEAAEEPMTNLPASLTPTNRAVDAARSPIELVGLAGQVPTRVTAGESLSMTLVWRSVALTDENLAARVELVEASESDRMDARPRGPAFIEGPPVGGAYPTDRWRTGEIVTDYRELPVGLEVPPGEYRLRVSVTDRAGVTRAAWPDAARFTVLPATAMPRSDNPAPLSASWQGVLDLVGYDGPRALSPGDAADIRLLWSVPDAGTPESVIDPAGPPRLLTIRVDGGAAGLSYVTVSDPEPGSVLATRHRLELPATMSPGPWRPAIAVSSEGGPSFERVEQHYAPRFTLGGLLTGAWVPPSSAEGNRPVPAAYRLPAIDIRPAPNGRVAAARFADGLRLVLEDLPAVVSAGGRLYVPLTWEAYAPPSRRYAASVQLLHPDRGRLAGSDREILHATMPTNEWEQGRVMADVIPFDLPAGLEPGGYQWLVTLYDQATKEPLPLVDEDGVPNASRVLFPVLVEDETARPLSRAIGARFGGSDAQPAAGARPPEILLREADLGPLRAGSPATVTLRWEALQPPEQDYTMFVHVLRRGELVAQHDGQPFKGAFPTTAWPPGQRVDTTVTVDLPAGAAADEVRVGFYDLASGRRLPAKGPAVPPDADYVVLPVR